MRIGIASMINSPIPILRPFIVWTIWFLVPSALASLSADDQAPKPTWRQGISQWKGDGYQLPAKPPAAPVATRPATTTPAPLLSETPLDPAPYTVPVDPTAESHSKPYFELPKTDDNAPLELTVPYEPLSADLVFEVAPPGGAPNSELTPAANEPDSEPETNQKSTQSLPPPANIPTAEQPAKTESPAPQSPTLSDKIATADPNVQSAPLQNEVIRWYHYPRKWMRGWDSNAELGIDGSAGNADTLAIQTGLELSRKTDLHTLAIDVDYRQASNRNTTIEDNGRLNIDYDRLLMGSAWSAYGKFGLEWDKFKAFDLRVNANGGVGYHWIRRDDATLVSRFGAGASQEIGAPVDDWIGEVNFGVDAQRQLTSRQKLTSKIDYFPAWENFGNYRLVGDIAWEILLDGTENLSLKLAATDRYDSTPQGAQPNDVYYALLLLYKF